MAIWNINTHDTSASTGGRREKFTAPYVFGLPQGVPRDGDQDNPFDGTADDLGTYNTHANVKYMHYCTRMLRWTNIDLTALTSIGSWDTCHVTSRFGDLGDMLGAGNDGEQGVSNSVKVVGSTYNLNSAMTRYRFDPIDVVKYSQYTSRGHRYPTNQFNGHPLDGLTCGWPVGAEDDDFHWSPDSTQLSQIRTDIQSDLGNKNTSLASLNALGYTWNLCVIAWCWAGYRTQHADSDGNTISWQGLEPGRTGTRTVDEVDIYYFPFIY